MLGSQTVIDVHDNTTHPICNLATKSPITFKPAKRPSPTVIIEIHGPTSHVENIGRFIDPHLYNTTGWNRHTMGCCSGYVGNWANAIIEGVFVGVGPYLRGVRLRDVEKGTVSMGTWWPASFRAPYRLYSWTNSFVRRGKNSGRMGAMASGAVESILWNQGSMSINQKLKVSRWCGTQAVTDLGEKNIGRLRTRSTGTPVPPR